MLALRLGSRKVHSLAFSPDGRTLAAGVGASVVTHDWQSGREVAHYQPSDRIDGACKVIDFGPGGATLTGWFFRNRAVTWDVAARAVITPGPADPWDAYTVSGTLVRGLHPSALWLVRYSSWRKHHHELVPVAGGPAMCVKPVVAAAPLAAWWDATAERLIGWWPAEVIAYRLPAPILTGARTLWQRLKESVQLIPRPDLPELAEAGRYLPPPIPVTAVAPCPDGRSALVGSGDQPVVWWDFVAGVERAKWRWPVGWVRSLAVDPTGTVAAVGGSGGKVIVWDWGG